MKRSSNAGVVLLSTQPVIPPVLYLPLMMDKVQAVFIHNPTAGKRSAVSQIRLVAERVGGHTWLETTAHGDAERMAREAALAGARVVVAVGGDGTVHEVVNGLMSVAHGRPSLAVLPIGSGNDFAFAAGLPSDANALLELIRRDAGRHVDIGSLWDDRGRTRYWCNTIGVGLNARIAVRASKYRFLRGAPKYVFATLATIFREQITFEVALHIDNRRLFERITLISLGNGPREGGAFLMTPGADMSDGKFNLLLVKPLSRLATLVLLPGVPKGKHLTSNAVHLQTCTSIQLSSVEPLTIHADGEIIATATEPIRSITVAMHHNALRLIG